MYTCVCVRVCVSACLLASLYGLRARVLARVFPRLSDDLFHVVVVGASVRPEVRGRCIRKRPKIPGRVFLIIRMKGTRQVKNVVRVHAHTGARS